ncbi:hypothetical protein FACS1894132_06550 [Clostridia bacterium]|nr:hypothetical protein FACS1894132_06550 [Clostridia bacterium]
MRISVFEYLNNLYSVSVFGERSSFPLKAKELSGTKDFVFREVSSLARTRKTILELGLCNEWQYFVTLTLDQKKINRFDIDNFKKEWTKFVRIYNEKYNCKLMYLLVFERHRDGAIHAHGLFGGISEKSLRLNKNGYNEISSYRDKFGYMSLSKIRSNIGAGFYITKYISKSFQRMCVENGKKCFICSQGLKRSERILCSHIWTTTYKDYILTGGTFVRKVWIQGVECLLALLEKLNPMLKFLIVRGAEFRKNSSLTDGGIVRDNPLDDATGNFYVAEQLALPLLSNAENCISYWVSRW